MIIKIITSSILITISLILMIQIVLVIKKAKILSFDIKV